MHARVEAKKEAARRARRLARELRDPEDRRRALAFAAELDDLADALRPAVRQAPAVRQVQVQLQQQALADHEEHVDRQKGAGSAPSDPGGDHQTS